MKINDYFSYILLNLKRNSNKLSYSIIIIICCIINLGIITFSVNFNHLIEGSLSNVVGFRTFVVNPREAKENSRAGQQEKDINDLNKIKYVKDVYDNAYNVVSIAKTSFKSKNLDGVVTLIRGGEGTLPTVVAGTYFGPSETNVAICPSKFFPTSNPELINKKELIDGEKIINTDFTVYYNDYIANISTGELTENAEHSKVFKIVGLYDVSEQFNDNGTCYISSLDIEEIVDTTNSWTQQYNGALNYKGVALNVVVDSINNVDYVKEEIIKLGFDIEGYATTFDTNIINIIKIVLVIVIFISLISVIYIVRAYSKKMMFSEEVNIATFRTFGFPKKVVRNLYALTILMNHFILYLIGTIIFVLIFIILVNNIPFFVGLKFMTGDIKITMLPFAFAFFSIIFIPTFVIMVDVMKKFKANIGDLFERDESRK